MLDKYLHSNFPRMPICKHLSHCIKFMENSVSAGRERGSAVPSSPGTQQTHHRDTHHFIHELPCLFHGPAVRGRLLGGSDRVLDGLNDAQKTAFPIVRWASAESSCHFLHTVTQRRNVAPEGNKTHTSDHKHLTNGYKAVLYATSLTLPLCLCDTLQTLNLTLRSSFH